MHKHYRRNLTDAVEELSELVQDKQSRGSEMNFSFDIGTSPNNDALNQQPRLLKLVHFSNKENLTHIDPKFKNTGVDQNTRGRDQAHKHAFFYLSGTQPEELLASKAHKYITSIDPEKQKLYDIAEDPEGLVKQAIQENGGVLDMDLVHEKLKAAGYFGFFNSKHPSLSNVIAVYHPLKVESHEDAH